jgi:nucleotide-binding universal stress UspA family protein
VSHIFLKLATSTSVREGSAETQILEEAESWGADLIVMSTHGQGAVSRFWLGSVADHCLRHSRVPLMLVLACPGSVTQGETLFSPKRVIVPLDGSELAERALGPASLLAASFGAPLSLTSVVDNPAVTLRMDRGPVLTICTARCRTNRSRVALDDVVGSPGPSQERGVGVGAASHWHA